MRRLSPANITWLKVIIWLAAILPFIWLLLSVDQGWFSADPAKDIQHFTGRMTLKFLLVTLLVTPVARYGKQPLLIRTRHAPSRAKCRATAGAGRRATTSTSRSSWSSRCSS